MDAVYTTASLILEFWTDPEDPEAESTRIDALTDTIIFHPFQGIVIAFGGNGQSPVDTNGDGRISDPDDGGSTMNEGVFDLAQDLYESGWDVRAFSEEEVDEGFGTSPPYDEVATAVDDRGVTDVAIFGYSQGGGATQELVDWLVDDEYQVDVSAFIDAIDHDGALEENNRPDVTYHLNLYQKNDIASDFLTGGPTDGLTPNDMEVDVSAASGWTNSLNHYSIDDDPQVLAMVSNWITSHISR